MLLYTCTSCGRWQDVSLAQVFIGVASEITRALNQQPPEQLGYPCPAGHGLMVQVQPTDRLYMRAGEVEALEEISKDVSALP
jgi:hypothetical protein